MGSPKSKVQSPKGGRFPCAVFREGFRKPNSSENLPRNGDYRTRNTKHGTRNTPYGLRFTLYVSPRKQRYGFCTAFTLLEVMIVIGIMGLMLTIGVPLVYKVMHRAPINQATADLFEVLSNARARAILQGKEVDVLFHPREGRFEIEGATGGTAAGSGSVKVGFMRGVGTGTQGTLSRDVEIRMLDINKLEHDFLADEVARVRFFPNGTSDELTLILQSGIDQRGVTLEITTGLASVLSEAELQRLRNGSL